ncbi:MAG TPA: IgGFc-binding protein [Polyangiaceae bacterium]
MVATGGACHYDPAYRDVVPDVAPLCTVGETRCNGEVLQTCEGSSGAVSWQATTDCSVGGQVCAPALSACSLCDPGTTGCQQQSVVTCDASGQTWNATLACDVTQGLACRDGACLQLCNQASAEQSNVGCEYWGADLDNADVSPSENAAAQQYAIVVSNVQPDVPARVTVEQDDSAPGDATHSTQVIASAIIAPQNLEVFNLGPREVDGSADGTFNTGTGTALTRHAYKVTSDFPIVAYQFNPLDNVNVFSNDASQLLPFSGLNSGVGLAYVVPSWPQTIAITSDPTTNFGINLRAFVAIVATRDDTHVQVTTNARVIPGGPFASGLAIGANGTATLQAFEVLNLETGDFNADFTGSLISADQPIAVFPGSEASDAPYYSSISDRYCCADHLEHQTSPLRAVGKSYVLAKMPNRTSAVIAAGANIGEIQETEYYRIVTAAPGTTHVTTTMASPYDAFDLVGQGASETIPSQNDFVLNASQPTMVLQVQSSQNAGGVPQGLPGGDPSTLFPSPREQWRSDYVLLTPDKYVFDYLVVVAPSDAHVYIDGVLLDTTDSDVTPSDGLTAETRGSPTPPFWTYRYQLSYPIIDPTQAPPNNVQPGKQNDGVHHIQADQAVGVIAYGFDSYVSYAYAGGTQLTVINPQ